MMFALEYNANGKFALVRDENWIFYHQCYMEEKIAISYRDALEYAWLNGVDVNGLYPKYQHEIKSIINDLLSYKRRQIEKYDSYQIEAFRVESNILWLLIKKDLDLLWIQMGSCNNPPYPGGNVHKNIKMFEFTGIDSLL